MPAWFVLGCAAWWMEAGTEGVGPVGPALLLCGGVLWWAWPLRGSRPLRATRAGARVALRVMLCGSAMVAGCDVEG